MRLLLACICGGIAAYWLAIGAGCPAWRDWPPGDAADIGVFVSGAILCLGLRRAREA